MINLTLKPDKAWIIREGAGEPYMYFMAHSTWTRNVSEATIFRDYDAADKEHWRARQLGFVKPTRILEVVPLEGAILKQIKKA